ncbi:ribokinase [Deinobacterium chartae]|uniref:Ribokinase n=1 Tax=Deinobacterium chartae TaxID=521158 RepID=A0A841I321_9DEIO|nr:ribokinase [Deinobacterium chartae]
MITVIGNANVDLVLGPHDRWPEVGTEALVEHCEFRPGGSAANSLLALYGLGANAAFVCGRGSDALGDLLERELSGGPGVWLRPQVPTSVSVGLTHASGERTFFSYLGHLAEMDLEETLEALDTLRPQGFALVAGAFLTPRLEARYPELLAALHARGLQVALDPGWPPAGFTAAVRAQLLSWLPRVDHLLINEAEAAALSGHRDLEAAAGALLPQLAGGTLVIKRGATGASAWNAQGRRDVRAPRVTVVDTVGAGDSFNAAYLWALDRGQSLEAALEAGVRCASRAISTSPRSYAPVDVEEPSSQL